MSIGGKPVLSDVKLSAFVSLQAAVSNVGPVPDEYADQLRVLLNGDDILMLVFLVRFLDDACKAKDYDFLGRGLAAIAEWQKEMVSDRLSNPPR